MKSLLLRSQFFMGLSLFPAWFLDLMVKFAILPTLLTNIPAALVDRSEVKHGLAWCAISLACS